MTLRRVYYLLLAVGLLASLFVAVRRERHEHAARNVEIVMDDSDFMTFARSYAYDERKLLAAMRRYGLTSLAVSEEIGANVTSATGAAVYSGGALLDQARIAPLRDPLLDGLVRANAIRGDTMYLLAYDAPTARRYEAQLPLKFPPRAIHLLRRSLPETWAIRTQSDYFAAEAFGLPLDRVALAAQAHLHLVPRLQNDEGFTPAQIDALVAGSVRGAKASTIVFFGLRNEVLGYPDRYDATAAALRANALNFGTIETYDPKQDQLGNVELARTLPDATVRVQAIAKAEADKLTPEEIIARYLQGVNERNVRVVYLRPYTHAWNGKPLAVTNVEIVRRIAAGIRASGKRLGPASPFERFIVSPLEVALASLAVPAILLLILEGIGIASAPLCAALVLADLLLVSAGYVSHHDLLVRQLLALTGGLAFAAAGLLAVGWTFRGDPGPVPSANPYVRGLVALALAISVTLGGALVITGLLSTPLTMLEIDRFAGVKYVLVLPALIGLGLYFFTGCFGAKIDWRTAGEAPVRVAQLVVGLVLLGGAFVILERSGNQSDIAPSSFELALRSHLSTILQVRPRFKEFVAAWPALMLVPSLLPVDRRRWGWLFILTIGVGVGDLIDTFSHLHTALRVGVERTVIGGVLGALIGAVAIAVYRRLRVR